MHTPTLLAWIPWTSARAAAAATIALCAPAVAQRTNELVERVYWDSVDASGALYGGRVELLTVEGKSVREVSPAAFATLTAVDGGVDPANRIDLVFVGDGYQAGQLGLYASQVAALGSTFFNKVPFSNYQPYFSVHRIDVVSVDSGVDHDPFQGVLKNTALDMGFWCAGIDRLLCVNVTKAYSFANNAPDVDLVAAIANSSTYGGAGYPGNDLATCSAGNSSALEIVRHEFGHALGNLADEYDYADGTTYVGAEPSERNVSKLTAAQMASAGTKWAAWLGVNVAAYDGLVDAFQGAYYNQFGVYRPTNNSLMRNLGRPFNLPSIEGLIVEIYKLVDPIDASSSTSAIYDGTETLFVTPMAPVGHSLGVQWSRDGQPIVGATGNTLDLSTLAFGPCPSTIGVTVTDGTSLVTDPALRAQWLTQSLSFTVVSGGSLVSNYCNTAANSVGAGALIAASGSTSIAANELQLIATDCPPSKPGLFFYGPNATGPVPFNNGFLCLNGGFFRLAVLTTDVVGLAFHDLDVTDPPAPAGQIEAGDTWRFQFWYRDPTMPPSGANQSDAVSVTFCP